MNYNVQMGIPEMKELWDNLQTKFRNKTINKKEEECIWFMGLIKRKLQ